MGNNKGFIQFAEKECPVCGRVGDWHTYCSDACKQKMYRKRRKEKHMGEFKALDSYLQEDFSAGDYQTIVSALNAVYGEDNAVAINDALILMVQVYHSKINKARATGRKL